MRNIPVGSTVHNVEMKPVKAVSWHVPLVLTFRSLLVMVLMSPLRLRSGEMRKVEADCRATLGEVGNAEHSCAFWVKQVLHAGVVFVRPFAVPR